MADERKGGAHADTGVAAAERLELHGEGKGRGVHGKGSDEEVR